MFDFTIMYNGRAISTLKAETDRKALNAAKKMYGPKVTVVKG